MYNFLHEANYSLWNSNFEKCEEILSESNDLLPFSSLLYAESSVLQYAITGELTKRQELIERLDIAVDLIKKTSKDDNKIKELAKFIAQKNKETEKFEINFEKRSIIENLPKSYPVDKEVEAFVYKERPEAIIDEDLIYYNLKEYDIQADKGMCNLLKGVAKMLNNDFISGAINLRTAWGEYGSLYKKCFGKNGVDKKITKDSLDKIKFGYGVFLLIVGILPDLVKQCLKIIGFKSNRELGVQILEESFASPGLTIGFSTLLLAVNYLFIPRGIEDVNIVLVKFKPALDFGVSMYPKSAIIRLLACQMVKKFNDTKSAIHHLTVAIETCQEFKIKEPNNFLFELGYNHFVNQNWSDAKKYFERAISGEEKKFTNASLVSLLLTVCYLKCDEKDKIIPTIKQAKAFIEGIKKKGKLNKYVESRLKTIDELCEKQRPISIVDVPLGEEDETVLTFQRKGGRKRKNSFSNKKQKKTLEEFLKKKIKRKRTSSMIKNKKRPKGVEITYDEDKLYLFVDVVVFYEILLFRRDLAHLNPEEATIFFKNFEESSKNIDELKHVDFNAFVLAVKGQLKKVMNDEDGAFSHYNMIIGMESQIKKEKQWIAFAKYDIGLYYYETKKYEEAITWIKQAKKINGYPFENIIKARADVTVNQIKKILKGIKDEKKREDKKRKNIEKERKKKEKMERKKKKELEKKNKKKKKKK